MQLVVRLCSSLLNDARDDKNLHELKVEKKKIQEKSIKNF